MIAPVAGCPVSPCWGVWPYVMGSIHGWLSFGGLRQARDCLAAASEGRRIGCGLATGKGQQNGCNLQPAMVDSALEADLLCTTVLRGAFAMTVLCRVVWRRGVGQL